MKKRSRCLSKTNSVVLTCFFLMALGVILISGPAAAQEVQLVIADVLLPTSYDPAVGADVVSRAFAYAAYEGLLRYIPGTPDIEPCLAESYEASADGMEYTFTLRQGVKFQDGSEFNAEAVAFSIDRIKKVNKASAVYVADIDTVEVLDTYKVKIVLKNVNPMFLQRLPMVYMVSPKYVKDHEENGDLGQSYLNEHMAGGTGPYYLESLSPGEHAVLLKNQSYWRGWGEKSIDKIIWRQVKESATRRMLLEKGDIHISNRVSEDDLVALEKNPNITVYEKPNFQCGYLRMNCQREPFNDVRVRKAMVYAYDYKAVIEKIKNNRAMPLHGPMPLGLFGHNDDLKPYETDLEKAKEILREAGYKPGDINITYMPLKEIPSDSTIGIMLQDNLKEIGINMEMQEITWVALLGMVKDPQTTPHLFGGAGGDAPINDSVDFLVKQFHSKSTAGASWNQNWYVNPKVDELLDKAKREIDPEKRAEYIKEVQRIVNEEVPHVFKYQGFSSKPMLKSVKGYKLDTLSWAQFNFYDMYLEE